MNLPMTSSDNNNKFLRVLIIEDSRSDAELLAEELKQGDYNLEWERVETAENLITALAEQTWDIIISDYSMPHFNALEALNILKEKNLDIPFIVVSGVISEDAAEVIECLKSGAQDFFLKGRLFRFLPAIERELQESRNRKARREAEYKLSAYTMRLEQSNKELEQFARIISHDVQGPLRKIRYFSDYLEQSASKKLNTEELDYIARIQKAIHKVKTHTEDLLNLSKVNQSGKPFKKENLSELAIAARIEAYEAMPEVKGQIEIAEMVSAEVDADQIKILLFHLMENGLKFQPKGASPFVKVSTKPLNEQFYEITVQDNGIGMKEENLERVFEPFQRLHIEGTLGLTLCKKIVERHKGMITVESSPGVGSTFRISLPFSPPFLD